MAKVESLIEREGHRGCTPTLGNEVRIQGGRDVDATAEVEILGRKDCPNLARTQLDCRTGQISPLIDSCNRMAALLPNLLLLQGLPVSLRHSSNSPIQGLSISLR